MRINSITLEGKNYEGKEMLEAIERNPQDANILIAIGRALGRWPEGSKRCNKCLEEKELKEFYSAKGSKDGVGYSCRDCMRIYYAEYARTHKDVVARATKRWEQKNRARRSAYHLDRYYLKRYGMTRDEYLAQKEEV